ncbi:MAG: ABC transporter substrate-binding protein [Candidatus Limnocylindria bacterium]
MEERNRHWRTGVASLAVTALIVAACGGGSGTAAPTASGDGTAPPATSSEPASPDPGGQIGGSVSVIGTWGGAEQDAFLAMVKPFEDSTGIKVEYTGTRDLNAVLTTGVASGILPDLAGLPGPGQLVEFAQRGALQPLDGVLDIETYKSETSPGFVDLGTVDGQVYGVFIKAAVKGLIWYNPKVYTGGVPTSWDDLKSKASAAASGDTSEWCVGLESGAASGWPGTDWIEDFVIRQSGPDVYDAWVAGTQKWTSPEIKSAFEAFGEVLDASHGGSGYVLNTNFGSAANPMFADPPGCLFHHQASFITSFFQDEGGAVEGDYDFFPMPDINPAYAGATTGAGDLFGMFNDTPQARALMAYLVTAEAQSIWVGIGGALSGNKNVTNYPDDVSARSAEILANATVFRFDGGDLMPAALQAAFFSAMVDFAQDQSRLDSILAGLDEVQSTAYSQ